MLGSSKNPLSPGKNPGRLKTDERNGPSQPLAVVKLVAKRQPFVTLRDRLESVPNRLLANTAPKELQETIQIHARIGAHLNC